MVESRTSARLPLPRVNPRYKTNSLRCKLVCISCSTLWSVLDCMFSYHTHALLSHILYDPLLHTLDHTFFQHTLYHTHSYTHTHTHTLMNTPALSGNPRWHPIPTRLHYHQRSVCRSGQSSRLFPHGPFAH